MRKLLFILLFLSTILSVYSQTDTATINLSGTVPKRVSIEIALNGDPTALDLETTVSNLTIASIKELSNSRSGYTLSISSSNFGNFLGAGIGETLPYTLTYGGLAIDLTTGVVIITNAATRTGPLGVSRDLAISYTSSLFSLVDDTYSDLLTLTIAAK